MLRFLSVLYLCYAAFIFIALMLIILPFALIFSLILPLSVRKKAILWLLRFWCFTFSITAFFWVVTRGKQNIDHGRAHIYIGNHGSYLDAIAVILSIPQYFSALGKIEMTKIPVFGLIYKRFVVMIDRKSKESRLQSVAVLKDAIKSGQSILIFPEGTMNQTQHLLADFYDGAFRIAIETQTPILPFVMHNSRVLLPRNNPLQARPGIITTAFLPVVEVEGLSIEDLPQLKENVRKLMERELLQGD